MDKIKELITATNNEDYVKFQSILEGVIEDRFKEKLSVAIENMKQSLFSEEDEADEEEEVEEGFAADDEDEEGDEGKENDSTMTEEDDEEDAKEEGFAGHDQDPDTEEDPDMVESEEVEEEEEEEDEDAGLTKKQQTLPDKLKKAILKSKK